MKLNFKKFKKYTKVDKLAFVEVDIRETFADRIYNETGTGIADLKLAEKIYASDENTDFTNEEITRMRKHAEGCIPWFLDGFDNMLNNN